MSTKICCACNTEKSLTEYQESGNWIMCRECNKKRSLRYYHANKERLNAKKVACDVCDIKMPRTSYYQHIKTKKHLEQVKQSDDNEEQ